MAEDQPSQDTNTAPQAPETSGEPNFANKHPLEHPWTLWFDVGSSGKQDVSTWGGTLRSVYTFDSVEDFWCLYNNIAAPSKLQHGMDMHLFKKGVEPKWEDKSCVHGGCWRVQLPPAKGAKQNLTDTAWLHALLGCIGEQFDDGDEICGVVVNVRARGDRICLWTRTASNEAVQVNIGKQLRRMLDMEDSKIGYIAHMDAKSGKGKDRYTL